MTEDQEEAMIHEVMNLDYRLTIYQMDKLLRVVGDMDESGPTAMLWPWFSPEEEKTPIWHSPYVLPSHTLMGLAQDRQLMDMGLIELSPGGRDYRPTEKGKEVAKWMVAGLEDLQFTHPNLPSANSTRNS